MVALPRSQDEVQVPAGVLLLAVLGEDPLPPSSLKLLCKQRQNEWHEAMQQAEDCLQTPTSATYKVGRGCLLFLESRIDLGVCPVLQLWKSLAKFPLIYMGAESELCYVDQEAGCYRKVISI